MKERERLVISDKKIINLYANGWSINDIVMRHKTSVRRVRNVLQDKGINTASYRSVSSRVKECILGMVATSLPVKRIAKSIDVSPHLIRQVLRDNKVNALGLRENASQKNISFKISDSVWKEFEELYLSGSFGFVKCAEQCDFDVDDCVEAVLRLTEEQVDCHWTRLRAQILKYNTTGLSTITVAKKFGVSTSIVKNIFNNVSF